MTLVFAVLALMIVFVGWKIRKLCVFDHWQHFRYLNLGSALGNKSAESEEFKTAIDNSGPEPCRKHTYSQTFFCSLISCWQKKLTLIRAESQIPRPAPHQTTHPFSARNSSPGGARLNRLNSAFTKIDNRIVEGVTGLPLSADGGFPARPMDANGDVFIGHESGDPR